MADGLPTDGKAELRMNTFLTCGFETNTAHVASRKLDYGGSTRVGGLAPEALGQGNLGQRNFERVYGLE